MDMINVIEAVVAFLLILFGLIAVFSKKTIKAVVFLSILSMTAVAAFALFKAPDIAVTEAVIGSGLVTFVFLITLRASRKEGDGK